MRRETFHTFRASVVPGTFLPLNGYRDYDTGFMAVARKGNGWEVCVQPGLWYPLAPELRVEVHPLGASEGVYVFRPVAAKS